MVTIKDVAKKANVSGATVSNVINMTRYVSKEIEKKVWDAIEELNYNPNYAARTLRMGKSNTIGLIIPSSLNPYFTELAWHIEQIAYLNNYSIIICNTANIPEREKFYVNVLIQKQVDGIVFVTCGKYEKVIKLLISGSIPFVILDRDCEYQCSCCSVVMTDEKAGAEMATEYLVSLGHSQIACITGGSEQQVSSEKRKNGYFNVLKKYGIMIKDELIVEGDFSMKSGYYAGKKLLQLKNPPTAIFAFNDSMALGVLKVAKEKNISIPDELSLVGYDNIEIASYITPSLTSISQPKKELAQNVMNELVRMSDRTKCNVGNKKTVLRPKLIVRNSCKKIN